MTSTLSTTRRWLTYLRERSPLPLLLAIAIPQAVSSHWLVRVGAPDGQTWLAAAGLVGLLVLLRLMDEVKDVDKDRVAHPERPIPRGLVSEDEVRTAIRVVTGALIVLASFIRPLEVVLTLPAAVGYAHLMYREFFVPRWLGRHAIAYLVSHQLIVVFMYVYAVGAAAPDAMFDMRLLWWAAGGVGASLIVEVGRKLDPDAHPALRTYLQLYGAGGVSLMLLTGLFVIAAASIALGYMALVLPFVAMSLLTITLWYRNPPKHPLLAGALGLASLVYTLSPTIAYAWSQR